MIEAGAVIGLKGEVIHWHLPPGRTGGSLPDSGDLWEVLWEHRTNLLGIAHSHPGGGVPGPSPEDVTTFSAIERALGKKLKWWIASSDHVAVFQWVGPDKYNYAGSPVLAPAWTYQLRELSHYYHTQENGT